MMNAADYRRVTRLPTVMSERAIRATVALLEHTRPRLSTLVASTLARSPIEKPPRHEGDANTSHFWIHLSSDEVEAVVNALGDLEAALTDTGAAHSQVSGAADLLDMWNRVRQGQLDVRHARSHEP